MNSGPMANRMPQHTASGLVKEENAGVGDEFHSGIDAFCLPSRDAAPQGGANDHICTLLQTQLLNNLIHLQPIGRKKT